MTSVHTIQKQYLHVELNGTETQCFDLQKRLSGICNEWLFPELEKVFDRFTPTEETWYFERIEIDAGSISADRLADLGLVVASAIQNKLQGFHPDIFKSTESEIVFNERKSVDSVVEEVFVYFLKTGRLPWSFVLPKGQPLEQYLLTNWSQAKIFSPLLQNELTVLLKIETVRKRLVQQFSIDFLILVISNIESINKSSFFKIVNILKQEGIRQSEISYFVDSLLKIVINQAKISNQLTENELIYDAISGNNIEDSTSTGLIAVLKNYWPDFDGKNNETKSVQNVTGNNLFLLNKIVSYIKKNNLQTETVYQLENQLKIGLSQFRPKQKVTEEQLIKLVLESLLNTPQAKDIKYLLEQYWFDSKGAALDDKLTESSLDLSQITNLDLAKPKIIFSPDIKEGVYINNAGLIILHPFLPQLFNALKIAKEDIIVEPSRALCLLHYLVTGQDQAHEYDLVLPKILCGFDIQIATDFYGDLSSPDKEEADALLTAVIKHWAVLKNTGIDGLRGAFLVRNGKLAMRDDGEWHLQVESQGFDILLGQLPWGIGMVKLPWMPKLMWVDWV